MHGHKTKQNDAFQSQKTKKKEELEIDFNRRCGTCDLSLTTIYKLKKKLKLWNAESLFFKADWAQHHVFKLIVTE